MIIARFAVLSILLICLFSGVALAAGDTFSTANELYSRSVDLAGEGRYEEALSAADEALALNATAINHLIQANRAGILVMLGRYDEAISAADAALAVRGNLTSTYAAAYYNKGDALRHLRRIDEARDAFSRAYALDNTLTPPKDIAPTPTKSSLPALVALISIAASAWIVLVSCKK